MLILSLLLCGRLALADEFFVEGPEVSTRAEAVSMAQAAEARGIEVRVVRRYSHGTGWIFVVVTPPYDERAQASTVARTMAGSTGRGMTIFATGVSSVSGDSTEELTTDGAPPPVASEEAVAPPNDAITQILPGRDDDSLSEVFIRIQRAHGGVEGGESVLTRADTVVFRFTRLTDTGQRIEHVYARSGEGRYLQIQIVSGEGESTTVSVTPEAAWTIDEGGGAAPVDRERALDAIERLSPERVLGVALSVARGLESRSELGRMRQDGDTDVDGEPCLVLRYDGDRVVQPFVMAVSKRTWRVRQLGFETGVLKDLSDYRETDSGVVYPRMLRVWKSRALIDTIQIEQLQLGAVVPAEWMQNPFAAETAAPQRVLDHDESLK